MFKTMRKQFNKDKKLKNGAAYFCVFIENHQSLFKEHRVTKIGYKHIHFLSNTTGLEYKTKLSNVKTIFGGTRFKDYEANTPRNKDNHFLLKSV